MTSVSVTLAAATDPCGRGQPRPSENAHDLAASVEIHAMNADGSGEQVLTRDGAGTLFTFAWSLAGR